MCMSDNINHDTGCSAARFVQIGGWFSLTPRYGGASGGWSWRRQRFPEAHLLMIAVVAIATLIRYWVDPWLIGAQYPTFFMAAIIATSLGGVCVGLLSVALSALSAWFFILPPQWSFVATNSAEFYGLVAFLLVATLMVIIIGSLQIAYADSESARVRAIGLEERARVADEVQLWASVFHNAAIGISIIDPANNTIRIGNEALASMHGMRLDEIQGRDLLDRDLYAPAERWRCAELIATSHRVGCVDFEADRIRKDGSVFPARIHITSVYGAGGDPRHMIATEQDITLQRGLVAERDQGRRLEAIGQLTAGVAHDFNNLLQAVIANLELVDDDVGVPPATRGHVGSAVRIAEDGGKLTRQLLSFARKQLLLPKAVDLNEFFAEIRDLLFRSLDPRIKIKIVVAPSLAPIWADPAHLKSAVLNLAINARDAMPSGGELCIDVSDSLSTVMEETEFANPGSFAVIRVCDTGTGIASNILASVCDPFFSTKGLNGTGLGLSMVHGFVKQTGGDLRITSEPGKGTCVTLWLPLASSRSVVSPVLLHQGLGAAATSVAAI